MRKLSVLFALVGSPALAASGPFFSLQNTNFVVLVAFIIFVGFLVYMGVPKMLTGMLDKRAATIKAELDETRALREEAKSVLASYERKQKEVAEQTDRIISTAKEEAMAAAKQAKADKKIAAKAAESEKTISEIRAGAMEAVDAVAKDTAKELVLALGGAADAKAVTAAVAARMKG